MQLVSKGRRAGQQKTGKGRRAGPVGERSGKDGTRAGLQVRTGQSSKAENRAAREE